ncbi:metallophosphoesterase [Halobacillus locisalis]|nr:metallophosphoesterase [Halobacillus locisalis]
MFFKSQHDHVRTHVVQDSHFPSTIPLTLFFISDIHNRIIKEGTLSQVKEVDLIIIGGDLVDKRTSLEKLRTNLDKLRHFQVPIYFVPGNNDHELKESELLEVLTEFSIQVLSNEDDVFEHKDGSPLMLSGMDPYFLRPRHTMAQIHHSDCFQILCVHDPFVYERMNKKDQKRFHLVLSGHTHGGQIRFLGFGPYKRGGFRTYASRHLLVSEGYGTSVWPLRLGTTAECHILTIRRPSGL